MPGRAWLGLAAICALAVPPPPALADGYLIVPWVQAVAVTPESIRGGESFQMVAKVIDLGGGIGPVVLDLVALGGPEQQALYDDGDPAHGDRFPGDGVYGLIAAVPPDWMPGSYLLTVRAYDMTGGDHTSASCSISVVGGTPVVHALDPPGDDHGPNQAETPGMYYTYPTRPCFVPAAFDVLELAIRRVQVDLGNGIEQRLAFQVRVGDFPDPSVPGQADWQPLFADLNLQKADIVIDTGSGGATASLPWRGAGYQAWNGWEYAIVMDGWFKAVVPSLGSNDFQDWAANARTADADIVLQGDFATDTITALVAPGALGHPSDSDIADWNICVQLAGHDLGAADVFGGIRWVGEASTEWGIGGGSAGDADANLMDLLLVPGAGRSPGRGQEYLLDYESPEAVDRQARGLAPVAIEMTARAGSAAGSLREYGPGLGQNIPNPCNPATVIPFELGRRQEVSLRIFDLAGRLVRTLIDAEVLEAGGHTAEWGGRLDRGRPAPAGTYLYRLEAGGVRLTKRLVLLK